MSALSAPRTVLYSATINPGAKVLWLSLQPYTGGDGRVSMTIRDMAENFHMSAGAVQKAVKQLEAHGYLEVLHRGVSGNAYRLLLP